MTQIKIIDENHPLFGCTLPGSLMYYDINHTGDSPDLFRGETETGTIRLLSTQIDVPHYEAQLRARQIESLGANEGDVVMISRDSVGRSCTGFNYNEPHTITHIDCDGNVEFDGGARSGASIFRPKVTVIEHHNQEDMDTNELINDASPLF